MKRVHIVLASIVGAAALASPFVHARVTSSRAAPLGTPERCAAYDGLPHGFGSDATAGMVRIAGGSFVPGSTQGYPEERPAGAVEVAPFWIDRTEVTNAQFEAFVKATGYVTEAEQRGGAAVFHVPTQAELEARDYAWWSELPGASYRHPEGKDSDLAGRAQQPVVHVTYRDATAYARWLGRRLPTEAEWELAARAGRDDAGLHKAPRSEDGRPTANFWQGDFPTTNTREDGFLTQAPVGCFPENPFGLHDMLGNVWEWTSSPYRPHDARDVPDRPDAPRVIKGGSYLCAPSFCARYRVSARHAQEADVATMHIGFRTVRDDG